MSCCAKTQVPQTNTNLLGHDRANQPAYEKVLKVIALGDSEVGKTKLFKVLSGGQFAGQSMSTIGVSTLDLQLERRNATPLKVILWDTAGQERFNAIVKSYYRGVHVAFVCFELGEKGLESKRNVGKWISALKSENSKASICLIGTKRDAFESSEEYAFPEELKEYTYFETSAATGHNIGLLKEFCLSVHNRIEKEYAQSREEKK